MYFFKLRAVGAPQLAEKLEGILAVTDQLNLQMVTSK